MICKACRSSHSEDLSCHECARRSLMTRYPLIPADELRDQLHKNLALHLLKKNDQLKNRAFLDAWEHGAKATVTQNKAPAHGLESRQLIESHMRSIYAARKAEAARLATRL